MAGAIFINGIAYSHASVEIDIVGQVFYEVKELKYNDSLDPGELRGTTAQMLAQTLGEYKAEGSISMSKRHANELLKILGPGAYAKRFDIVASYREEGLPLITDTLRGCRLKKNDAGSSQGNDPTMITFDLSVFYILWDGVQVLPNMLVG